MAKKAAGTPVPEQKKRVRIRDQIPRNNHILGLQDQVFGLDTWDVIPMVAQSADWGQPEYNIKGVVLAGGTYLTLNGLVIWKGLSFSANSSYNTAFALNKDGSQVRLSSSIAYVGEKCADETAGRRVLHLHCSIQWEYAGR